jgi:hypothetical protein
MFFFKIKKLLSTSRIQLSFLAKQKKPVPIGQGLFLGKQMQKVSIF